MGIVVATYELSSYALGIENFMDQYRDPPFLSFKDLPYLPERYTSLMDDANAISRDIAEKADAEWKAGFAQRARAGFTSGASKAHARTPEQATGSVLSRVA